MLTGDADCQSWREETKEKRRIEIGAACRSLVRLGFFLRGALISGHVGISNICLRHPKDITSACPNRLHCFLFLDCESTLSVVKVQPLPLTLYFYRSLQIYTSCIISLYIIRHAATKRPRFIF